MKGIYGIIKMELNTHNITKLLTELAINLNLKYVKVTNTNRNVNLIA